MTKQIIKSEFINDVNVVKMKKKELAAKYELPATEITKLLKAFGLRISSKKHATYVIVDDTATSQLSSAQSEDIAPTNQNSEIPVSESIN